MISCTNERVSYSILICLISTRSNYRGLSTGYVDLWICFIRLSSNRKISHLLITLERKEQRREKERGRDVNVPWFLTLSRSVLHNVVVNNSVCVFPRRTSFWQYIPALFFNAPLPLIAPFLPNNRIAYIFCITAFHLEYFKVPRCVTSLLLSDNLKVQRIIPTRKGDAPFFFFLLIRLRGISISAPELILISEQSYFYMKSKLKRLVSPTNLIIVSYF